MPTATPRNQLKVNRPINTNLPRTANDRQIQRASNDLRVLPILVPHPPQLTQQQLKPKLKPTQNKPSNRLEAPYKKPNAKPASKAKSRTISFGDTTLVLPRDQEKLAALKQEAVDYWNNLKDIQ